MAWKCYRKIVSKIGETWTISTRESTELKKLFVKLFSSLWYSVFRNTWENNLNEELYKFFVNFTNKMPVLKAPTLHGKKGLFTSYQLIIKISQLFSIVRLTNKISYHNQLFITITIFVSFILLSLTVKRFLIYLLVTIASHLFRVHIIQIVRTMKYLNKSTAGWKRTSNDSIYLIARCPYTFHHEYPSYSL